MTHYSIKPRAGKYVKENGFLSFMRNLPNKYGKKLLDTVTKAGLDAGKTGSKKVVHKIAEPTEELVRNKIAEKIVEPKPVSDVNSRNLEEIVSLPEKRQGMLNELRQVL